MASFLGEIKRRKVFQVTGVYLVVAWLIMQVVDVVTGPLLLPDWFPRIVIVLLAIGLPIAVVLSWAFELTPHGMVRDQGSEAAIESSGRRIEYILGGLLILAIGWIGFQELSRPTVDVDPIPNSVAVLPLENLSPDPDNAYFAAGMHEEILSQLSKLRDLSVISRTSVLRYEDSALSIPEIAAELNVETIMEGSVRYADNRVRITMQLIDGQTDEHLWSDTYDREFEDIFSIESDIAMNIANALEAEFSDAEQESIEQIPTTSPAAYQVYLRALSTGSSDLASTISDLNQAITLDPQFALAYGYKALRLVERGRGTAYVFPDWEGIAQEAIQRALVLDPNLAWAHAALGGIYHFNWRSREAQEEFDQAYQLNPNDPDVLEAFATFARNTGQYEEALRLSSRLVTLDPNGITAGYHFLGAVQLQLRNYDAAERSFRRYLELNPGFPISQQELARTELARGNESAALRELQIAEQFFGGNFGGADSVVVLAAFYSRLDRPSDASRLLDGLRSQGRDTQVSDSIWAELHLANGEYDQARTRIETAIASREFNVGALNRIKANTDNDPVLEEPAWLDLRAQIHPLE